MHCGKTLEVGYDVSKSTTVTNSWTASLSEKLGDLTATQSFTKAYSHYKGASFSVHSTTEATIDVPPGKIEHLYQRVVEIELVLESAPPINVDGDKGDRDVSIHGSQFWFDNPYGGSECECDDNGLIHIKLGFMTDCYSNNPDEKQREKHCP